MFIVMEKVRLQLFLESYDFNRLGGGWQLIPRKEEQKVW